MIGWRIIMTVFSFKSYEIATALEHERCRNRIILPLWGCFGVLGGVRGCPWWRGGGR